MPCQGQQLGETVESAIRQYFEEGTDLADIKGVSSITLERMRICLDVYEHMEQDPTLDVRAYLRHIYHRSISQIHRDEQVLDIVLSYLSTNQRKRSQFIVQKTAEKLIRAGDQSGDLRYSKDGAKMLMDMHQLDKPEQEKEDIQQTAKLPYLLVPIEMLNPNAQTSTEEQTVALFDKYDATHDEMELLVRKKMSDRLQAAGDIEDVLPLPEE